MRFLNIFISLLKEARPSTPEVPKDLTDLQSKAAYFNVMTEMNMIPIDDRQLMGRFGVWLLIGLCKPKWDTPKEIVGRLLSILFHWFHVTAYSFDGMCFSKQFRRTKIIIIWKIKLFCFFFSSI